MEDLTLQSAQNQDFRELVQDLREQTRSAMQQHREEVAQFRAIIEEQRTELQQYRSELLELRSRRSTQDSVGAEEITSALSRALIADREHERQANALANVRRA